MSRETLLDGVVLECSDEALVIRSAEPLRVLSSAVLGGGRRSARTIFSLRVPRSYDCRWPERDLRSYARRRGLPQPVIGLMTAAPLGEARVLADADDGVEVRAIVTVGLHNAARAGEATASPGPGTINAILLCDARLREAAAVELIALASEAKASALLEAGLRTARGSLATGTSTDATVIAWRARHRDVIRYAGSGTGIGALVARLVRAALASGSGARAAAQSAQGQEGGRVGTVSCR